MKTLFFLIHDLGNGGAEKVLVNLVNNLNKAKYDVTVMSIFGGGVNEKKLASHVHYKTVFKKMFRGNSHLMKLFTPGFLHKMLESEVVIQGRPLTEISLEEAITYTEFGNAVASLCVEKRGAIPAMPTLEEVRKRL